MVGLDTALSWFACAQIEAGMVPVSHHRKISLPTLKKSPALLLALGLQHNMGIIPVLNGCKTLLSLEELAHTHFRAELKTLHCCELWTQTATGCSRIKKRIKALLDSNIRPLTYTQSSNAKCKLKRENMSC
ncbi:hypothetical protein XENORESO_022124 [Xenotaenia resolanae]|uniref:Uncharacterized protein n=1 Tax=Xenotaenia resolanae TaxID=208358 RepID=A0ABV0WBL6_9TELE